MRGKRSIKKFKKNFRVKNGWILFRLQNRAGSTIERERQVMVQVQTVQLLTAEKPLQSSSDDCDDFSAVMRKYQAYIYTICYRFVLDAALAEDLAQETFLSAYLHWQTCPPGSEKPWLARIAVNKAKDALKSGWNRKVQLAQSEEDPLDSIPSSIHDQPEECSLKREKTQAVRRAVLDLPNPYHDVAVLVFLQEKTPEQAAKLTQRPVKTVYTQLTRAKKMLAGQLKEVADK